MIVNNPTLLKLPLVINNRKEFNQFKKNCKTLNYSYPDFPIKNKEFPITIQKHDFKYIDGRYDPNKYVKFCMGVLNE